MKKPFKILIDHFNETHGFPQEGSEDLSETEPAKEYEGYDEEYNTDEDAPIEDTCTPAK